MRISQTERDIETHNKRVGILMQAFVKDHPGMFRYEKELITAAYIHDIGKQYIPHEILDAPRKLLPEERAIIDWHAYFGYELAKEAGYSDITCIFVMLHHGKDKPKRVKVERKKDVPSYYIWANDLAQYKKKIEDVHFSQEIMEHADMLRVLDAYDALTSKRPYRPALSDQRAMEIIRETSEFSPRAVKLLEDWTRRAQILQGFAEPCEKKIDDE